MHFHAEHKDETFESCLALTARFKGDPRVISRRKAAASAAAVGVILRMKPNRGTPTPIPSTPLPQSASLLTSSHVYKGNSVSEDVREEAGREKRQADSRWLKENWF